MFYFLISHSNVSFNASIQSYEWKQSTSTPNICTHNSDIVFFSLLPSFWTYSTLYNLDIRFWIRTRITFLRRCYFYSMSHSINHREGKYNLRRQYFLSEDLGNTLVINSSNHSEKNDSRGWEKERCASLYGVISTAVAANAVSSTDQNQLMM